ncbi:hypothetical protein AB0M20_19615 [Actinoplanes sp. NPDC051633]|uniref:hypothetical protein n=1 Tax=Actinoplanes sp. NPDC051633 TaxID=3155670 RepID=UPI00342E2A30
MDVPLPHFVADIDKRQTLPITPLVVLLVGEGSGTARGDVALPGSGGCQSHSGPAGPRPIAGWAAMSEIGETLTAPCETGMCSLELTEAGLRVSAVSPEADRRSIRPS